MCGLQEPAGAVLINPARYIYIYIYIYIKIQHISFLYDTYISSPFSTLLQGDWKTVTSVVSKNSVIVLK